MRQAEIRRKQNLMRLQIGLLAASLALCAVHFERLLRAGTAGGTAVFPPSRYAAQSIPRPAGPSINWGGQKR